MTDDDRNPAPGPWRIFPCPLSELSILVDANGNLVAKTPKNHPRLRIIKAAPEMLEALKDLVKAQNGDHRIGGGAEYAAAVEKALTVIAKAEETK